MTFDAPPINITSKVVDYIQKICLILGTLRKNDFEVYCDIHLRKANRIKTIKSGLSIEGNSLSLDQVSDILNGVRVIAPPKDIIEVKNAMVVYEKFDSFDPFCLDDLLVAHGLMMDSLVDDAGKFRNAGVGIFKGK
jgi:Fic family protein